VKDDGSPVGLPNLTKRSVKNVVYVADGATVVIGGIISSKLTKGSNRVPWLGDIPVLGWAFRNKSKSMRKINLIVFLTPHIVRSPAISQVTNYKQKEFETSRRRCGDGRGGAPGAGNRGAGAEGREVRRGIRGQVQPGQGAQSHRPGAQGHQAAQHPAGRGPGRSRAQGHARSPRGSHRRAGIEGARAGRDRPPDRRGAGETPPSLEAPEAGAARRGAGALCRSPGNYICRSARSRSHQAEPTDILKDKRYDVTSAPAS
jgi:hypothetical protein